MSSLAEMLEDAKRQAVDNATLEINKWAFNNPTAADELRRIWTKNLVVGHKAMGRMLLGKPVKSSKEDKE